MKTSAKKHLFRLNPISQVILLALSTGTPMLAAAATENSAIPQQVFTIEVPKKWMPRVSITGEYGNYGVGQVDLFTPFISNNLGLVFFDLRATATAHSTQEYNGALGFRTIVGDTNKAIVGAHIWDDRKHTQYGNFFNQGTLGLEYFGNIYSVTSNIYVPYGERKQVAYETTTTPFVTGHTVGYYESIAYETALRGIDIEVGKQDLIDRHLRVYADYYHFGEGSDSTKMNGGRLRTEYIIESKWLNQLGSDVMLTASYQYDNVQHSVGFAGIRLNIGRDYHPTDPLVGRLEEYIIRDNDIVAPVGETSSTRVTDPDTFIFVDNTKPSGGNGTKESPYNNEQEAIAASKSGDIIYTYQGVGNYTMPSGGLNLKQNQVFFGSGSDYVFNNVIVIPATGAPTLNGRINVANNDTINGLTFSGQGSSESVGIFGDHVSNVAIINTTVQGFSGEDASGASGSGDNGLTGGNAYGIQLENSNNILLSHVNVNNIHGGDANGGSAETASVYYVEGGRGGTGGQAVGIDLRSSSAVTLSNVSLGTNIHGGDANGGSVNVTGISYTAAIGGSGGTGGSAIGIDLHNSSSVTLSQVNVGANSIHGGDAHGGSAQAANYYADASGGRGGRGGQAIGIKLDYSSEIALSNVNLGAIHAGSANGGSAETRVAHNSTAGNGGAGESATGLDINNSSSVTLSQVNISGVSGGSANGGDATNPSSESPNTMLGGHGGVGGNAVGINSHLTSSVALSNVSVSGVSGGTSNGGQASGTGRGGNLNSNTSTAAGAYAGDATGIDLSGASLVTLSSVSILNISGGSANGGDATVISGTFTSASGGYGGTGGSAVGIKGFSSLPAAVTISGVTGGSATGGTASGATSNTQGAAGATGSAHNYLP